MLADHAKNRKNLRKALEELGYGDHPEIEIVPFISGRTQFYMTGGLILDIVDEIKGG
jgi:hypothetical protein